MRRVPLFVKAAVVSSSATLLVGFVALKAGWLNPPSSRPAVDERPVHMAGTKSAPLGFALENRVEDDTENGTDSAAGSATEAVKLDHLRAFSSKSSVPLLEPDKVQLPPQTEEAEATGAPQPMLMPGSKSARVFVPPTSSNETSAPPRTMMSGSKSMAPLLETAPPAVPKAAPQTYSKGYKGKGS